MPFQAHLKAYTNKLIWADGSCSDLVTYLNLYKVWRLNKELNNFGNGYENQWAANNFISIRCLKEWAILIEETKARLDKMGIRDTQTKLSQMETPLVLKVVIAGAFYPNYFLRSKNVDEIDEREAVKEVGGRDPFTTVYFKNMQPNHPGPLYAKRIRESLADIASNMQIHFDGRYVFTQNKLISQLLTSKKFVAKFWFNSCDTPNMKRSILMVENSSVLYQVKFVWKCIELLEDDN